MNFPSNSGFRQIFLALPKLPVPGWSILSGPRSTEAHCVADLPQVFLTGSGRAAISLALRCIGIQAGDRVLVPTYHCPSMIAPVVASGAAPLFFPIGEHGEPRLCALRGQDLRGVRAMIAAHYFGVPQPMAALRAFCDEHQIALIEDCAHAMFGEADGRPVGSWGDYAIASIPKFFPAMDGGLLASGRNSLASLVPQPMPFLSEIKILANILETGARYQGFPGFNRLLAGLFSLRSKPVPASALAVAGTSSQDLADSWLRREQRAPSPLRRPSRLSHWALAHAARSRIVDSRRRNFLLLESLLADLPGTHPLVEKLPANAVPYVYPLWVDDPERSYQAVRQAGIPVYRWDEAWPGSSALEGDQGPLWGHHLFQLGCHQDLRPADIRHMAEALRAIMSRARA
jgi:selenocysteine lyase/cysteine desulfurase